MSFDGFNNVPHRQVRTFFGQQSILEQIQRAFSVQSDEACIVVLRAMGGQGKTQVALRHCRLMKDHYYAIFWVDASSESSLKQAFSSIYDRVNPQVSTKMVDNTKVESILQCFAQDFQQPWLLVLDNYDDPQNFNNLQDFMPDSSYCKILVTSRHADTKSLAEDRACIELPGMKEGDSIKMLLRTAAIPSNCSKEVHEAASLIVQRLGYHPLAIDQAGAYLRKSKLPITDFLEHYEQQQTRILNQAPPMS
jgi:hypothetical protein